MGTPGVTGSPRFSPGALDQLDLDAADAAVDAAIHAGDAGPLRVLGYGEITLTLGWPSEEPELALKRLPVFRSQVQLDAYEALLRHYLGELERRGVNVVETNLVRTGGSPPHAYLVQPLVPEADLLDRVLESARPDRGEALLRTLADTVARAVDSSVGLDAQVANWAVSGDQLADLDVSTPLMRSPAGEDLLDVSLFLSIYPAALHVPLRRVAHDVMGDFHNPRQVLVDVASNLVKERLDRWLPAMLAAANRHVSPPITQAEVSAYFRRDRRLWLLMQRLRRADRAWQRRVRRRAYPFLLPPPYRYGPPELPERRPR